MARRKKIKVFVSYSRHDEALVKPLAGLPGVAADDAVFLDVSSLRPSDLWDEQIMCAVKEASVFVLCWCCVSESSTFVAREISAAVASRKKKLVPVLFCSTPLPPGLAERQWIDLRGQIMHNCLAHHAMRPPHRQPPRPGAGPGGRSQAAGTDKAVRVRDVSEGKACRPVPEESPEPLASAPAPHPPPPAAFDRMTQASRTPNSAAAPWFSRAGIVAVLLIGFAAACGLVSMRLLARPPLRFEGTSPLFIARTQFLALFVAALSAAALLSFSFLLLRRSLKASGERKERLQAEEIAAAAAAYFQTLGKT